jgi:uncharacterized membrane protein YphA (DoxX/SURF4 family)
MSRLTPCLLVLLRLAIGWHFFFEGLSKLPPTSWPVRALKAGQPARGVEQAKKEPFSSEMYLRESVGPLSPYFRGLAGDTVLERVEVPEPSAGDSSVRGLPPALEADWNRYLERFIQHYHVSDVPLAYMAFWVPSPQAAFPASLPWYAIVENSRGDSALPNQRSLVQGKFNQLKAQTATWLALGVKKIKIETPGGPAVEVERTTPERVRDYKAKLEKARKLQDGEMAQFGADVNARLRAAKAEANQARAELRRDVDDRMLDMKKALHELLTSDQRKNPVEDRYNVDTWETTVVPAADPIQASWSDMTRLQWADWITRWGLFTVGVLLLLGLFTRTACVAGAGFLLLFYLALPPLPGLPDNPRAEGSYLFINKNIIEMLALLALATTSSGKWVGLDGLVQLLNPFRRRTEPRQPAPDPPKDLGAATPRPDLVTSNGPAPVAVTSEPPVPVLTPEPREPSHGD